MMKHVIRLHGIPDDIVSDRDVKFTNNFWRHLMESLKVKLNMSSTAHPQTDGQSERTNRTVITMLRSYVNEKNNNWVQYIPIVEIYINNSKQSSSEFTPFYCNYGFNPCFDGLFDKAKRTNNPSVEGYVKNIHDATELVKVNLRKAQERMKTQADLRRRDHNLKVNDLVYLTASYIKPQSGISKLNPLAHGPFKITKKLNDVTFQLDLPKHWKLNSVFHLSLLKPAYLNDSKQFPLRKSKEPPKPEIQPDRTPEFEIERIVDKRKRYNKIQYRVRWKGYGIADDTWEYADGLCNAQNAIREYERNKFNVSDEEVNQPIRYKVVNPHRIEADDVKPKQEEINAAKTDLDEAICVNLI